MTAAAPTAGPALQGTISRIAPSGAPVELTVPSAFGDLRWYGNAKFVGPRTARQFFLAPAGEHRVIPTHILRGAREQRIPMRGFDAVLYEAADRSDSALVLAGPHHEATSWFGGPAPDAAGLNSLLTSFRFTDAAQGATILPMSDLLIKQADVSIIGRSEESVLVVRRAVDALPTLPEWAGLPIAGGELWRAGRMLSPSSAALTAGTPHQWRYLIAGPSAAMDVVFLGPESGRPRLPLDESGVVAALGGLTSRWGA